MNDALLPLPSQQNSHLGCDVERHLIMHVPHRHSHSSITRTMVLRPCTFLKLLLLFASSFSHIHPSLAVDDPLQSYQSQLRPLFQARCFPCHGALKQEANLRLDSVRHMLLGGDSGPALTPDTPTSSLLWQRITSDQADNRMPPLHEGEPFSPSQRTLLLQWIQAGAPFPPEEQPEQAPQAHWAFQPISDPQLPIPPSTITPLSSPHPIDRFLASLEQPLLPPLNPAPRETQIRRLYTDLHGYLPTREQLDHHLSETNPNWYESLVDQLLDDPAYGERWGRHWMDVWRYSDWWGLGDQARNSHQHIWHWRDWILDSLNQDLPYDEMVRQMLAADELYPDDLSKLRATGFLARNYFLFNRNQWMDETVEHVGKAFLGLTLNCAKCHDHKYDPLSQKEYFSFRAIFEPYAVRVDMIPGQTDLQRDGIPVAFDATPQHPTYLFIRGEETRPDTSQILPPQVPHIFQSIPFKISPQSLPLTAVHPERRPWVLRNHHLHLQQTQTQALDAWNHSQQQLRDLPPPASSTADLNTSLQSLLLPAPSQNLIPSITSLPPQDRAWLQAAARTDLHAAQFQQADHALANFRAWSNPFFDPHPDQSQLPIPQPASSARWFHHQAQQFATLHANIAQARLQLLEAKDQHAQALEQLSKAIQALITFRDQPPEVHVDAPPPGARWVPTRFLDSTKDDPPPTPQPISTGRRTALAQWLTHPDHPLLARTAVNQIWMRHFGSPLVDDVFDFGRKHPTPRYLPLLDWLARDWMRHHWSMKHLHRTIVTSAAYRRDSQSTRLDASSPGPTNLHLSHHRTPQRLDAETLRDSLLHLSHRLDRSQGGPPVPPAEQTQSTRRSLYLFHSNNDRNLFLTTFDSALVKECYRRDQSVLPQQALALSHSQLALDAAKAIATQLLTPPLSTSDPHQDFLDRAFHTLLGRGPSPDESQASLAALQAWLHLPSPNPTDPPAFLDPHAQLIWVLLNHHDFITLR